MLTFDQVQAVIATAVAAPSVHNTQPWLFEVGEGRLDVRADRSRALPRQDPSARELVVSCAAASLFAELAVRSTGHGCSTVPLPLGPDSDVVARLLVGDAALPSTEELRLVTAVPSRHTDRGPYADWPVPVDVLDRLGRTAEQHGAWLQVLTTADMLELAVLQVHAQAAVLADPEALAERASWARTQDVPEDGVPEQQVPGWPAGRAPSEAVRVPVAAVHDVVLVLGTDDDDPYAWVRAGRALAGLLLDATASGLVAAPATLALELPAVRGALTRALALRGAPQMVLRTGYPAGLAAQWTGRRPVEQVLVAPVG